MFLIQVSNFFDQIIFSNLHESCRKCYDSCKTSNEVVQRCPVFNDKRRRGKVIVEGVGKVYLCTSDPNYVKSARLLKEKISVYEIVLREIISIKDSITEAVNRDSKRLVHNLTSLNAHNIQEIYNLVPQDLLTEEYKDQISIIRQTVTLNPDKTAQMFIRIAKNNSAMKTEFAVFKKIYEPNALLLPQKHIVRKVVFNVLHTFFQDFTDLGIYVDVQEGYDKLTFDYESLHVALYHILENATKYAASGERMFILFDKTDTYFDLIFEMLSVKISKSEIPEILKEGGRGEVAKLINKQGGGIGLSHVVKILALINAELIIVPNIKPSFGKYVAGHKYEINQFIIRFKDVNTLNK